MTRQQPVPPPTPAPQPQPRPSNPFPTPGYQRNDPPRLAGLGRALMIIAVLAVVAIGACLGIVAAWGAMA